MNNYNDRFVYKEGEINIVKSQCDLCLYKDLKNINICAKYPKGKPKEVLNNIRACKELKTDRIEL